MSAQSGDAQSRMQLLARIADLELQLQQALAAQQQRPSTPSDITAAIVDDWIPVRAGPSPHSSPDDSFAMDNILKRLRLVESRLERIETESGATATEFQDSLRKQTAELSAEMSALHRRVDLPPTSADSHAYRGPSHAGSRVVAPSIQSAPDLPFLVFPTRFFPGSSSGAVSGGGDGVSLQITGGVTSAALGHVDGAPALFLARGVCLPSYVRPTRTRFSPHFHWFPNHPCAVPIRNPGALQRTAVWISMRAPVSSRRSPQQQQPQQLSNRSLRQQQQHRLLWCTHDCRAHCLPVRPLRGWQ